MIIQKDHDPREIADPKQKSPISEWRRLFALSSSILGAGALAIGSAIALLRLLYDGYHPPVGPMRGIVAGTLLIGLGCYLYSPSRFPVRWAVTTYFTFLALNLVSVPIRRLGVTSLNATDRLVVIAGVGLIMLVVIANKAAKNKAAGSRAV
jgi:hypothetical protein